MREEESNDGDASASIDGDDDESFEANDNDNQLNDSDNQSSNMNFIESVDPQDSDEEYGSKLRKINFSSLNLQGKPFKLVEGG